MPTSGLKLFLIAALAVSLTGCSGLSGAAGTASMAIAEATGEAPEPAPPLAPQARPAGHVPASVLSYASAVGPTNDVEVLMAYYAKIYGVPLSLVRRVAARESNFNPRARNGPYWGVMQILPQTARTMGYRGASEGLLDPDTNLRYAVKYLAGAYLVARGDEHRADRFYQSGYYFDAKRAGLLRQTGLIP